MPIAQDSRSKVMSPATTRFQVAVGGAYEQRTVFVTRLGHPFDRAVRLHDANPAAWRGQPTAPGLK